MDRLEVIAKFYNPDQPRDDHGRWTSGGTLPKAVAYLEKKAGVKSTRECAKFVREALAQDGIDIKPADRPQSGSAKDFGPALEKYGFERVASVGQGAGFPPEGYKAEAGDVAVIQDIPGHKDGHMAMYTGKPTEKLSGWVSDYKQPHFYPGDDYSRIKPPYVIYRHK